MTEIATCRPTDVCSLRGEGLAAGSVIEGSPPGSLLTLVTGTTNRSAKSASRRRSTVAQRDA